MIISDGWPSWCKAGFTNTDTDPAACEWMLSALPLLSVGSRSSLSSRCLLSIGWSADAGRAPFRRWGGPLLWVPPLHKRFVASQQAFN